MIPSFALESSIEIQERTPEEIPKNFSKEFECFKKKDFLQNLLDEKVNEDLDFQIVASDSSSPKSISFEKKQKSDDERIECDGLGYTVVLQPLAYSKECTSLCPPQSLKKLEPLFFSLEKAISIQDFKLESSLVKSVTYLNQDSPFHGLEINLEFFDTHPRSINIELIGSPQTNSILQKELPHLQALLKNRFESIEFPKIATSLAPIFPTGLYQQKSKNKVSEKKVSNGKIVFKPMKSFV